MVLRDEVEGEESCLAGDEVSLGGNGLLGYLDEGEGICKWVDCSTQWGRRW